MSALVVIVQEPERCRPCPDEEGTETSPAFAGQSPVMTDADLVPMKRELKRHIGAFPSKLTLDADLVPMKRELKLIHD